MANEEAGFFRFDTNAGTVAADIESAMRAINEALASAGQQHLSTTQMDRDIAEIRNNFHSVETSVAESLGRIRAAMSSGMKGPDFGAFFRTEVRSQLAAMPAQMANDLGAMAHSTAARAPMQELGRRSAAGFVQAALKTVRESAPELVNGLSKNSFAPAINAVASKPVEFGAERDRLAVLRNRLMLQNLARQTAASTNAPAALAALPAHLQDPVQAEAMLALKEGRITKRGFQTTPGLKEEIADLKRLSAGTDALAKYNAEQEHYNRILEQRARGNVKTVGTAQIVNGENGREYYKSTGEGTARRVGDELEIGKILQQETSSTKRLSDAQERLNKVEANRAAAAAKRDLETTSRNAKLGAAVRAQAEKNAAAEEKAAERTAKAQQKAAEQRRAAVEKLMADIRRDEEQTAQRTAAAQAAAGDTTRRAGRIVTDDGVLKVTPAGVAPEEHPVRIADAQRAQQVAEQKAAADAAEQAARAKTYQDFLPHYYAKNVEKTGSSTFVTGRPGDADAQRKVIQLLGDNTAKEIDDLVKRQEAIAAADAKVSARSEAARKSAAAAQKAAASGTGATSTHAASLSAPLGPLGTFQRGFRGVSDVPYLQQAGQAAKFSLLYGSAYKALALVTAGLQQSVQEGIAFQQGLSDMAVATGRTKEQLKDISEKLAITASENGSSPSAGLQIGARSIGLYGLAGTKDAAQQDYVSQLSAQVVTRASMGTGVDPVTLQQNVAAVTQALGMGAGGQIRVTDLDQYFSKRFGSAPGDTIQAASDSASVGVAAGFSPEQIQGLAALMIGRTGQSSTAVGGYLAQIFSRGGEGSLTNVADRYGIQTQGRGLNSVFADLSKLYKKSDPNQQAEISAAFGRGKVQNAVVAALQSWDKVASEANKAENGAADGALDKAFKQRISNVGGQIELLTGDFKEFAHLFGESGLLTVLGAGIKVLDLTVKGLNDILSLYNQLSPAIRDLIAVMVTGAAVGKLAAGTEAVSSLANGIVPIKAARRAGLAGQVITNEAGTATAMRVGADGVAAAGKAALSSLGPWALATGGLIAISELQASSKELKAVQENTIATLKQAPGADATPAELRNYASQLTSQATDARDKDSLTKKIVFGQDLGAEADRLDADAKRVKAAASEVADGMSAPVDKIIAGYDKKSIADGLDAVSAAGGEAVQRIGVLERAINKLGHTAESQVNFIDPGPLTDKLLGGSLNLTGKTQAAREGGVRGFLQNAPIFGGQSAAGLLSQAGAVATGDFGHLGHLQHLTGQASDYGPEVAKQLDSATVQKRLTKALKERGIDRYDQLTNAQAKSVTAEVTKMTQTGAFKDRVEGFAAVQGEVSEGFYNTLVKQRDIITKGAAIGQNLTGAQAKALGEGVMSELSNRESQIISTDYSGKINAAKRAISQLTKVRNASANKDLPSLTRNLQIARTTLANNEIDQFEALRKVAVQNAPTDRAAVAAGHAIAKEEIESAVRSRNAEVLARAISMAGKGAKDMARRAIEDARKVALAAYKAQEYFKQDPADQGSGNKGGINGLIDGFTSGDPQANPKKGLKDLLNPNFTGKKTKKQAVGVFDQMLDALKGTNEDASADGVSQIERPAEVAAARSAAFAVRTGGDIASARAALVQANTDLNSALPGTIAYYQALGATYQARQQLNDALLAYRRNVRAMHTDMTDPVKAAQLDLQTARDKLRADAGKGRDVRAQDRVDVQNTQNAAEAAKFQQRLSDAQTAEQLGRISHAAYIHYLQSEHDRLESIKHRTRQQTDELNTIDLALKDAKDAAEGQFNLGDINTNGLVYQVRRQAAEARAANASTSLGNNNATTQQTVTISVNGADVAKVQQIIKTYLNAPTHQNQTLTRRKR